MRKHAMKRMAFPDGEVADLNHRLEKNLPIYTIRVSEEGGKYTIGDIVKTNLTPSALVVDTIVKIDNLGEYPFESELTDEQRQEISLYDPPYDVIRMVSIVPSRSSLQRGFFSNDRLLASTLSGAILGKTRLILFDPS